VEDTTFYVFDPLISHNEVGDSPETLGISTGAFHHKMLHRQKNLPYSLNATSTHDTKRGEDARLRIDLLSEIPDQWEEVVLEWMQLNKDLKEKGPSKNEEYFIYQSLIGGYPFDLNCNDEFKDRVKQYLVKSLREAKVNTNWSEPDEQYESSVTGFVDRILDRNHSFLSSFEPFVKNIMEWATVYSLAQTIIKITAPGIPDFYQGSELWDLSYVDPDNRRAIDYELRKRSFGENPKQSLIQKALQFRRRHNDIFIHGKYLPIQVPGAERDLLVYARVLDKKWVIVIVPLGIVTKMNERSVSYEFSLPDSAPENWVNELSGADISSAKNKIKVTLEFEKLPIAFISSLER